MIRLLIDKVKLLPTSSSIRNLSNVIKPSSVVFNKTRSFTTQVVSQTSPASLAKDVIVFQYENPRFFKLMNIFTISQFFFWGYLGHWSFTSLRNAPISDEVKNNDEISWWKKINMGEAKYKSTLSAVCFAVGYLVLFVSWTYTLRSVRYMVALKNGKDISLVTYTPFGKNRRMDVPISCISAQESRTSARVYLPLKVKNRSFFYILDMKGEFKNTKLFDQTIALSRKF